MPYIFLSYSGDQNILLGETGGQADIVRQMVAFRSIANALKEAKFGATGQLFSYFNTNRNNSHVMCECGTTH